MKIGEPQRVARILVLGDAGVGKTALVVRCLTRRFLPEYVSGYDSTHVFDTSIDEEQVHLELVDSSRKNDLAMSLADAFVIVYSIVNRESFNKVSQMMSYIKRTNPLNAPVAIVANKTDLGHARKVTKAEGTKFAKELKASLFCELSVANDISNVQSIFHELYKRVVKRKQKLEVKVAKKKKIMNAVAMMKFAFTMNKHMTIVKTKSVRAIKDSQQGGKDRRYSIASSISL